MFATEVGGIEPKQARRLTPVLSCTAPVSAGCLAAHHACAVGVPSHQGPEDVEAVRREVAALQSLRGYKHAVQLQATFEDAHVSVAMCCFVLLPFVTVQFAPFRLCHCTV